MTSYVLKLSVRLFLMAALGHFVCGAVVAQIGESEIRRLIYTDSWSAEEILSLEKGEAVVRPIKTMDKQELVTIGVVRIIRKIPYITMDMFRRSLDQRSEGSMKTGARFSQPPIPADLKDLELDDGTIAQLRKCTVRSCDLNLSAKVIDGLQAIDWMSPDAEQQAAEIMREMLVDHARGYSTRGVSSLGTYDNRRTTVDLTTSHRALLQSSSEIFRLAPEFADYLAKYPEATLANVENTLHWSVVDFGLKPTITLSHAASYTKVIEGSEQFFIASRQIYSSRYLDSSLSFAVLIRVGNNEDEITYLLFIDRSRSDALDGPLGSMARAVVKKEAAERVRRMLDKAHIRLLTFSPSAPGEPEEAGEWNRFSWLMVSLLGIAVAVLLILAYRKARRRSSAERQKGLPYRARTVKLTARRAESSTPSVIRSSASNKRD